MQLILCLWVICPTSGLLLCKSGPVLACLILSCSMFGSSHAVLSTSETEMKCVATHQSGSHSLQLQSPISLIFMIFKFFSQSALRMTVSREFCLTRVRVCLVRSSSYLYWVGTYSQCLLLLPLPSPRIYLSFTFLVTKCLF